MTTTPFERFVARLENVKRRGDQIQARCPAHSDRGPSLSVTQASDGTVLCTCFAGCSFASIFKAVGLEMRDAFPARSEFEQRTIDREHTALMRRYHMNPKRVLRELLDRELQVERDRLRGRFGYVPPLKSEYFNNARRRVGLVLGLQLAPIPPLAWECAPHDDDPAWPTLFDSRMREVLIVKYGDPEHPATSGEQFTAALLAAGDLHEIACAK